MESIKRKCLYCNEEFIVTKKNKKFCSQIHQILAWQKKTDYPKKYRKKRYYQDPEFRKKILMRNKQWREDNPEKWKKSSRKAMRKYKKKYRKEHPEKFRDWVRIIIKNTLGNKCSKCNSTQNLEIHHKNKDYQNSTINDVELLCKSCHLKIHSK